MAGNETLKWADIYPMDPDDAKALIKELYPYEVRRTVSEAPIISYGHGRYLRIFIPDQRFGERGNPCCIIGALNQAAILLTPEDQRTYDPKLVYVSPGMNVLTDQVSLVTGKPLDEGKQKNLIGLAAAFDDLASMDEVRRMIDEMLGVKEDNEAAKVAAGILS